MGFKGLREGLEMNIKSRTEWMLKNNNKITVLVLEAEDGLVEFTEDRLVFSLPTHLFLQCFEELDND